MCRNVTPSLHVVVQLASELRNEEAVSGMLLMQLIRGYDSVYVVVIMGISSIGNPPENGYQLEGVGGGGVT
jgi:hypothetical protein